MAIDDLRPGDMHTRRQLVTPEHFASRVAPEAPDVFSTPALGALAEAAASGLLLQYIDEEQVSVGTQLVVNHTAPTPEGLTVEVTVTVTNIDGRQVDFDWQANDGKGDVGRGTHQRLVVNRARFLAGVEAKKS